MYRNTFLSLVASILLIGLYFGSDAPWHRSRYLTFQINNAPNPNSTKIIKFGTKAMDDRKCIGLIMKPLEVQEEGPRIFFVNCEEQVKCGYRGNPYKESCKIDYVQNIPAYYLCLSKNATAGQKTACSRKKLSCKELCPKIEFDLWMSSDHYTDLDVPNYEIEGK